MSVVSGIDDIFLILIVIVAIAAGIAVLLIIQKKQADNEELLRKIDEEILRHPVQVKDSPGDISSVIPQKDTVAKPEPVPKKINCIQGMTDISQSLAALSEKYSLEEIILATSDGLLLASSSRTPPAEDIARYCGIYQVNPLEQIPGIMLFGVQHKGSSLVGIAKTGDLSVQERGHDLITETQDILNWWI
ncbi:MAG TPA: hypothetical protein PKM50_04775 [Methanoregula sp.]|nr:hypothetical protein [Methanoregula sp.]